MGRVVGVTARDLAPSESGYVQLRLERPVAALFGDRVVLRDGAARMTLAGGRVVDPAPPPRRGSRDERLAVLAALDHDDPAAALARRLDVEGSVDLAAFARTRNLDPDAVERLAERLCPALIGRPGARVAVSPAKRTELREALLAALARWHAAHPEVAGPNKAELLRYAASPAAPELLEAALADLVADGLVCREHAALRLPEHRPRLPAQDESLWSRLEPLLAGAGLRPPRLRELAETLGLEPEAVERKLVRFERFGRLMRVAENRFFLPDTVAALAQVAASLAAEAEDGTFAAAAFKDRAGIGRNLTIEVLEFLDRIGATRRLGDRREVIRRAEDVLG
jgi:selenocysteine-specific elongation factor